MSDGRSFSSPSFRCGRHSDDLNGRQDASDVFRVFSNFENGRQVYENSEHKGVRYLKDYAYGQHIAAVVALNTPNTFVVAVASEIFMISNVNIGLQDWCASVEDSVACVYASVHGRIYRALPFDGYDPDSKTCLTMIDIHGARAEWIYRSVHVDQDHPEDDGVDNEMEAILQMEARY